MRISLAPSQRVYALYHMHKTSIKYLYENQPSSITESVRTDEGRQEFITEKYIGMKYASDEDKERVLRERQEARAESVRRTAKLIPHRSRSIVLEYQKVQ